jgi:hypothetical protein
MVDSRQKGATAETAARDLLRKLTDLKWERVPGSGMLDAKHGLKGDLYVPKEENLFAVEVKHYKDSHLDHSVLTGKNPQLLEWWEQAERQGRQLDKKPLLLFKHDRSKFFVAFKDMPTCDYRYMFISALGYEFYTALLEDWISNEVPEFIS